MLSGHTFYQYSLLTLITFGQVLDTGCRTSLTYTTLTVILEAVTDSVDQ